MNYASVLWYYFIIKRLRYKVITLKTINKIIINNS